MQLIFNAKALRPPVTGVGNYTYHLLEQYLQGRYAVDEVYCFSGTHWLTGSQQLAITADIRTRRETSAARSLNGAVAQIREAIGKIQASSACFHLQWMNGSNRLRMRYRVPCTMRPTTY
ncbi:MAG: hypothetical protein IPG06_16150 [Haliea sp.]|nr:hypothetical protein [Haliea sp.]